MGLSCKFSLKPIQWEQRKNVTILGISPAQLIRLRSRRFESWGGSQTLDVHCARRQADLYIYIYNVCNVYVYYMYRYILYIYIHTLYVRIFFQEGIFSIFPTCANPGTRTSMFPIPIPVDQTKITPAKQHIEQASNHQKGLTRDSQAFNAFLNL